MLDVNTLVMKEATVYYSVIVSLLQVSYLSQ